MPIDAYGKQTITSPTGAVRQKSAVGWDRGFTGYIVDQETGLLHARARQYSPTLGRFISRDPGVETYGTLRESPIYYAVPNMPQIIRAAGAFATRLNAQRGYHDGMNLYFSYLVPNYLAPSGLACSLGEAAEQVAAVGPVDASTARQNATVAINLTMALMRDGTLKNCQQSWSGGEADAFRHCVWMCFNGQSIGFAQAIKVGTIHEDCNPANNPADRAMDLQNNAIGAALGMQPTASCQTMCLSAL